MAASCLRECRTALPETDARDAADRNADEDIIVWAGIDCNGGGSRAGYGGLENAGCVLGKVGQQNL